MLQPIEQPEDIIQYDYYLSGPMSGYEDHNFPAFNREANRLREEGFTVFNPAESFNGNTGHEWEEYIRVDTMAVARCENILMLPGWRRSRGACFEYLIAKTLGINIHKVRIEDQEDVESPHRIALLGYARTGKDTVGSILVDEYDYRRVAIGDIIKSQVDPIVQAHLGHSAFTEDDDKKENIRELLVHMGYANYLNILEEFLSDIPMKAVNTRLFRFKEALEWNKLDGGEIWLVNRPGYGPEEPKVKEELDQILDAGLVDRTIYNDQDIDALAIKVDHALNASPVVLEE